MGFFWGEDDLLTCKNQDKTQKKQPQNNNTQCQTTVNIPLALMKQFNLFPVARRIVAIIHIANTYYNRSSTYTLKKEKKYTYNGQGDLELILNSRQLLNL